jgi:hypothetical protein
MFGRRPNRRLEITPDERRERQIERVHTLTYALLLDVIAWFMDLREPVDEHLFPEYHLPDAVRSMLDPRERLATYVSTRLLAAWEPARERWLSHGAHLKPDFGTSATLQIEGLDGEAPQPLATARFTDRSVVEIGGRRQYLSHDWVLTAWLAPDLTRIENAAFAAADAAGESSSR